jgi:membrane-associated phospholipid phosphatase
LIATTPVDGAHYFIDTLAGLAIAVVAMACCHALSRHAPGPAASSQPIGGVAH